MSIGLQPTAAAGNRSAMEMPSSDFTMMADNGEMLTSDNRRMSASFVMHGDASITASTPLSPIDVHHHVELAKSVVHSPARAQAVDSSKGFVLVGNGSMEGSEPLSPADRKLYYKRQSFRSPRPSKEASDLLHMPDESE